MSLKNMADVDPEIRIWHQCANNRPPNNADLPDAWKIRLNLPPKKPV